MKTKWLALLLVIFLLGACSSKEHGPSVPNNDLNVEQSQEKVTDEKAIDKIEEESNIIPKIFPLENAIIGELSILNLIMTPSEDATKGFGLTFHSMDKLEKASILILNEDLSLVQSYPITLKTINVYKADIMDLEPNTTYQYIIQSKEVYSNLYLFTSMKETGPITLGLFGDPQGYKLSQYENLAATYKAARDIAGTLDISLIAGDIVDTGDSKDQWGFFYGAMEEPLSSSLFATAIGNHDLINDSTMYVNSFNYPLNGVKGLEERNYYFDVPGARIAVWDTEASTTFDEQAEWLIETMEEVTQGYRIVLMHRSAYPMAYDEVYIRVLSSIMEEAGVHLVLSGHDHIYSRTTMLQDHISEVGTGVTYIVGGSSSGSKVYQPKNIENRYWKQFVYEGTEPVFTLISIDKDVMHIQAYATKDNMAVLIDTVDILGK